MKRFLSLLFGFFLLFGPVVQAYAADEQMMAAVQQSSLLIQLKQKLAQVQYRFTLLQDNLDMAEENLTELDSTIENLNSVISNLEGQIQDKENQILNVKSQKERKKMDVANLEEEVQLLELKIIDQKKLVSQLMTLLYVKRGTYFDDGEINPVKVLASDDSVSETLQKITYLDLMEAENQTQTAILVNLSDHLSSKWTELRTKKSELDNLDTQLAEDLARLQTEHEAQKELLEEMLGEQAILEAMLTTADQRGEDLLGEIKIYENNVKLMEEKLAGISGDLSQDQQVKIQEIEDDMRQTFESELAASEVQLAWPVSPDRGLTAFFRDTGYQATFGVDHFAIDIRANQGSSIFAPADGVVSEVVYDGASTRYSYIMIAHRMGVMTLYGHISEPAVSVGDYVTQGQIIGFSGGTPHSVGSGVRTTGPHLHFEVWQDGVRVDPLEYLDLTKVPNDNLPDSYKELLQAQLEGTIKELENALD